MYQKSTSETRIEKIVNTATQVVDWLEIELFHAFNSKSKTQNIPRTNLGEKMSTSGCWARPSSSTDQRRSQLRLIISKAKFGDANFVA